MHWLNKAWTWLLDLLKERELWIAVVAATVLGVSALVRKLPQRLWRRLFSKSIRVKVIRRARDPDLHAFLGIYEQRIAASYRVANDDIIAWVGGAPGKAQTKRREDLTLVAKHEGEPIAILKAILSRSERLAFIAYLANSPPSRGSKALKESLGRQGVAELLAWLGRRLKRRGCTALVFEVPTERGEAKMRRFREYATLHGRRCCRIEMGYLQPHMELGTTGSEKRMTLTYVSLADESGTLSCSLQEAVSVLSFVYLTVYGTTFAARHGPEESATYMKYLEDLLARQVGDLPGRVALCAM